MKAYVEINDKRLDVYIRLTSGFYWFCADLDDSMVAKIDFADLSRSREVAMDPEQVADLLDYAPGMLDELNIELYYKSRNKAEKVFEPYLKEAGLLEA